MFNTIHKSADDGTCVKGKVVAFSKEISTRSGDGLIVEYLGRKYLCIMEEAFTIEVNGSRHSFVTVSHCEEQEHPILSEKYHPMTILHKYLPYTSPRYPSVVRVNQIKKMIHLPHACVFEDDIEIGMTACVMENGEIKHSTNQYVVYNTLLVEHSEYQIPV